MEEPVPILNLKVAAIRSASLSASCRTVSSR